MSKAIRFRNRNNEAIYVCPYFPVGSIYLSAINVNPSNYFGGTWIRVSQGRFLVGVGTVEDNNNNWCGNTYSGQWTCWENDLGGECRHTITFNELPSHNHMGRIYSSNWNAGVTIPSARAYAGGYGSSTWGTWQWTGDSTKEGCEINNTIETSNAGNNYDMNNLPPYYSVYVWRRIE